MLVVVPEEVLMGQMVSVVLEVVVMRMKMEYRIRAVVEVDDLLAGPEL